LILNKTVLTGEGESINFRIYDYNLDESVAWYNDNIGSLTVRIYDVTDYVVVTDDSGEYSKDLMNGEYQVIEINQPGWVQTAPSRPSYCHLTVENGSTEICEFGNTRMGSIDGYKLEDTDGDGTLTRQDARLSGWEINLWTGDLNGPISKIQTKTTNSDGYYKFDNLLPGIYWVTETQQEGWTRTAGPAERGPLYIEVGTDLHGNNFGNFELGKVQGYKWEDMNGDGVMNEDASSLLEGWKITLKKLDDYSPTVKTSEIAFPDEMTGENGHFEFDNLMPGEYELCEEMQDGWMQTHPLMMNEQDEDFDEENNLEFYYFEIKTSGQVISGNNFGNFELGEVSGYKWDDDNGMNLGLPGMRDRGEPKLPGWTIELHKTEPSDAQEVVAFATTETDDNGDYVFKNLIPGTYYLIEVAKSDQQDWVQTYPKEPSYHEFTIATSGQEVINRNFGNNLTADLEVTKVSNVTQVERGSQVTYTVSVKNVGTEDIGSISDEGVNVWDDIPVGVDYVSSEPSGTYDGLDRRLTWSITDLEVDELWTATITVEVPDNFDENILEISNRVQAMRDCEVSKQNTFSSTLVLNEGEKVIEYCEIDPTTPNNSDTAEVDVVEDGTVGGASDEEELKAGSIKGIATKAIGQVLGASNELSDTGKNLLLNSAIGIAFLSSVVALNFSKAKKRFV
jgi:uncharacterized repeat protein (TIGR01451 family)